MKREACNRGAGSWLESNCSSAVIFSEIGASWRGLVSSQLIINCVSSQVEQQGTQLEMLQQRNLLLQEENNVLKEKTHNFERYGHLHNDLYQMNIYR